MVVKALSLLPVAVKRANTSLVLHLSMLTDVYDFGHSCCLSPTLQNHNQPFVVIVTQLMTKSRVLLLSGAWKTYTHFPCACFFCVCMCETHGRRICVTPVSIFPFSKVLQGLVSSIFCPPCPHLSVLLYLSVAHFRSPPSLSLCSSHAE